MHRFGNAELLQAYSAFCELLRRNILDIQVDKDNSLNLLL